MTRNALPRTLIASLTLGTLVLVSATSDAVGTRRFVLDTLKTLEGGDLTGVSIASNGTVQAGWTLGATPVPDATSVWSTVALADGSVLLGTGSDGKIFKVARGKVTVAAECEAMAVSAMTLAWNGDVVAGTFPEGNVYRLPQNHKDGDKPKLLVKLPKTEDIWALAFDPKRKVVYAATGPEGKLYRIDATGKAEVHYDSEESHLVSVAVGPDGSVYAGSNGKALLYKLTGPGRVQVVHDFEGDDVKGIAVAPAALGGAVYAIANEYKGATKGLRPKRRRFTSGDPEGAKPQDTKSAKPGKGQLMRFDASGAAELLIKDDGTHFVSLALDPQGVPFVGSGAEGQVFTVDANHVTRMVADTEERQVGAIVLTQGKRYIATSDPVVFHEITGEGGPDAVWTSKVLDAKLRAHFGMLEFRADGALEVQTRSGNTVKPDDSWSAWSKSLTTAAKVVSPAARYLQIRARWARDPKAVLHEVKVSFVTDNARGLLTEVTAGDQASTSSSGNKVPESGGPIGDASSKLKLRWKVDNPDNDKLRYRLVYRMNGRQQWFSMLDPDEQLTKTDYQWDTTGLPEGRYRVRVDASDELANPPDRVTRHSLESGTVIVDNTAPVLSQLQLQGRRLSCRATDGVGPIARLEFALAGSKTWVPLAPTDGVFDQATESFAADIANLVPPGPQLLVVRAYDEAGNRVTRNVEAK